MGEHGILMKDEMVRAILDGRKTVTRRTSGQWARRKVGDLLWVRECFAPTSPNYPRARVAYRASGMSYGLNGGWATSSGDAEGGLLFPSPDLHVKRRWMPGIHMPRWASRLTLRVTDIRQEPCSPSSVTHRWVGGGPPSPQPTVWLYGSREPGGHADADIPGYERAPHPWEPLPWVDDAEARREGVADRAAYLALWESINGDVYPTWVWRIAFEVTSG